VESTGNFIEHIVESDLASGRHSRVVTRFPPEPNGYLHIGHAKAILVNYGLVQKYQGQFNLRMDDTNPLTEDVEYEQAIQDDMRWLGVEWGSNFFHASDYYEQIYLWAEHLVKEGKAYVCDLSAEEMSAQRGTFTEPGKNSPYRDRSVEENLDLLRRMRAGEFADGSRSLRAKIDMASPNPTLRDPAIYRIRKAHHHRTGDAWCIYPLYDYAHPLSDAIEGITHSLCSLEFETRRPLYDWVIENCPVPARPRQYEFARLKLSYTVMSKRKLLTLVREKVVSGWDDPRMPTIRGYRRRGYTPTAITAFAHRVGVAKADSLIDVAMLEAAIRDELNESAPRAMAVLRPLKVVIENWPEGKVDEVEVQNHPLHPEQGTRKVPFGREIWIERDDFMEDPPKKFFRLGPGREVRLRGAYFVTCTSVVKDDAGNVVELRCSYDPATRGGDSPDGRKVKGTLHWAPGDAPVAKVRLYDRLFKVELPDDDDWKQNLNPGSLEEIADARIEPMLASAGPESRFQFERLGYFYVDPKDSAPGKPVFHRTVTLKDSWAKEQA
jgi:glutaminyl-tRNA synthetase